jgi:hypothetical protein
MQNDQSTHPKNKLHHYGFLELVHSARLERLGEGLAICSGKTVAAHWVEEPVADASASGCLIAASRMEDVVPD